jgi:hypothetical protein
VSDNDKSPTFQHPFRKVSSVKPRDRALKQQEYLTKLALIVIFLGGFGAVVWMGQKVVAGEFQPNALDLLLLGLAAFRLGRLVAYDLIMEPLRSPVAHTVPDESGAGDNVEARGAGAQRALGQLISCPICAGTWIAALLAYGLYLLPGPTRLFLMIAAAIGLAELINSLVEALCWSSQLARAQTGAKLQELRSRSTTLDQAHQREKESDYFGLNSPHEFYKPEKINR